MSFDNTVSTESIAVSQAIMRLHEALSTVRDQVGQHLAHRPDLMAHLEAQLQFAQDKIKDAQQVTAGALSMVLMASLAGVTNAAPQMSGASPYHPHHPPTYALVRAHSSGASAAMEVDVRTIPAWRPVHVGGGIPADGVFPVHAIVSTPGVDHHDAYHEWGNNTLSRHASLVPSTSPALPQHVADKDSKRVGGVCLYTTWCLTAQ